MGKVFQGLSHDFQFQSKYCEPKRWGRKFTAFATSQSVVTLNQVKPGGHCSVHHHEIKTNRFVLLNGDLEIHWYDAKKCEWIVTNLGRVNGKRWDVLTHVDHRFYSKTGCLFLEVEFALCKEEDIVRHEDYLGGIDHHLQLPELE